MKLDTNIVPITIEESTFAQYSIMHRIRLIIEFTESIEGMAEIFGKSSKAVLKMEQELFNLLMDGHHRI